MIDKLSPSEFFTILLSIFIAIVMLFWIPTWYMHAQEIQKRVYSGIVEYTSEYEEIHVFSDDKETVRDKMYNNLSNSLFMFSRIGKAKESEHQYKLALYEILGYINVCTDGCSDLIRLNDIVEDKRDIWISDLYYFVYNDIYAMWHTK